MKKRYTFLIAIVVFVGIVLFFLSSIVKWYIVKNSKEIVGRRISIEKIHFNYFQISVRIENFVLYETSGTDTFVTFNEFFINFDPLALLKKEYAFSEIRLINPKIAIIQNGTQFNFDDLLDSENTSTTEKVKNTKSENVRFLVRNIKLSAGLLSYTDRQVKNHVVMQNLDLQIPLIAWDSNQSDVGVRFQIGEHGFVKLGASLNNLKHRYIVSVDTHNVDLNMVTNNLKQYLNLKSLKGYLTSNLLLSGNLDTVTNMNMKGTARVDHLSMLDNRSSSIFSAEQITAKIKEMDLGRFHFGFSNIKVTKGRLLVILNKNSTNIIDFLQPSLVVDTISRQKIDSTALASEKPVSYSLDTIRLENSVLNFRDNTLNRPFAYDLKNIDITLTQLTGSSVDIPLEFKVNLNDKGEMKGLFHLNMLYPMEFKAQCSISKMDLVSFSPYSEYYIASPITQGIFDYGISLEMSNTRLDNRNKVCINGLKFGKRTHDKTAVKAPVRLALYILKDMRGRIAFDLPVEGNPSDPKFSLSKIIWQTVGNFCVKVASEPFKSLAGLVTTKPENINKILFEPTQDTLSADNLKTVHLIAELMRKKPGLKFLFKQYTNSELEKRKIASLLVKEQYIRAQKPEADSLTIMDMAGKLLLTDEKLKAYLATKVEYADTIDPSDVCIAIIGNARLDNELLLKIIRRNWSLQKALGIIESLPEESFRIETADLRNIPDEMKTTMFQIEVALGD